MATPNMNLVLPTVGTTAGPTWATELNAALTIIDVHDHTAGFGAQVPTSGLNINADLSIASYNLTDAKSVRYTAQGSPLAGASDLSCVYVSGVDLYYNDGLGNQVRLTESGGVAGTPGSISNLTSPASAAYVSANSTFVWQSDASTSATMDMGSIIIRENVASAKGVTIQSPTSLSANYALTLPTALPASTLPVVLSAAGALSTQQLVAAQIANGTITTTQIASATILGSNIAASTITDSNILAATITGAKIASGTITSTNVATHGLVGSNLAASSNFDGYPTAGSSYPLVQGGSSVTNCVVIAAGRVRGGSLQSGSVGISSVTYTSYNTRVNFSRTYNATPAVFFGYGSPAAGYTVATSNVDGLNDGAGNYLQDFDILIIGTVT